MVVLLDAITDFLGIFEIIIVVMIIIEVVKLIGGGGGGGIKGLSGLSGKIPDIFGGAAKREEDETKRNQRQERAEEGEERRDEVDLAEAEKLLGADLNEAEQVRNFLEQVERVPLTPEYAQRIAKEKGGALKTAVGKLLNYSERAGREVGAAYKQNYAALNTLGKELKERAVVDARAERDKLPRDQKDARAKAYDAAIKAQHARIQAYLNDIRRRVVQAAAEERKIEQLVQQTDSAEKAVVEEVNTLVAKLSRGDTQGATSAATLAIRSLQAAEAGLRESKQFVAAVRTQIAAVVGELYNTKRELNKELVGEHFEAANARKM